MPVIASGLFVVALGLVVQNPAGNPASSAQIAGRVVDGTTRVPIGGANVILVPATRPNPPALPFQPPPQIFTNADGSFSFPDLAPGRYRLQARKAGYVGAGAVPGDRPPPLTVAAGQSLADVEISLQRGAVLAGVVLPSNSGPVAEAMVMALRPAPSKRGPRAPALLPAGTGPVSPTNDLGEFRVSGLPPGEYYLHVNVPSRFGETVGANRTGIVGTSYPGVTDVAAAQMIKVEAGQTINGLQVTMATASLFTVSGAVVDDMGRAVPGAMIMLLPGDGPILGLSGPPRMSRAGESGSFSIGDVPSGSYRVQATQPRATSSSGNGGFGVVSGIGSSSSGGAGAPRQPTGVAVTVADSDVSGVTIVLPSK